MLYGVLRERWKSTIETNEVALQMIASGQLRKSPGTGEPGEEAAAVIRRVNEDLKSLLTMFADCA